MSWDRRARTEAASTKTIEPPVPGECGGPVSLIVRITTGDVIRDGGQVLLRLGDPPSPVPRAGRRPPAQMDRQPGQHEHGNKPPAA
jgi:hypothetical protein